MSRSPDVMSLNFEKRPEEAASKFLGEYKFMNCRYKSDFCETEGASPNNKKNYHRHTYSVSSSISANNSAVAW